jgi:hypothetical protein
MSNLNNMYFFVRLKKNANAQNVNSLYSYITWLNIVFVIVSIVLKGTFDDRRAL